MPIAIRGGKLLGDVDYEIVRLKRLAVDLERYAAGSMPSNEDLAGAPLLDDYAPAQRPMLCLVGHCTDHPRLRGPIVMTTDLWVTTDLGWCRTLGRYYRLGSPRDGGTS
ncbi:MAG: DUF6634 family protein [Acetobacteraceae bacterium]